MNNQQLLGQITERKPNANSSMQVSSIEPTQNQLHFWKTPLHNKQTIMYSVEELSRDHKKLSIDGVGQGIAIHGQPDTKQTTPLIDMCDIEKHLILKLPGITAP